VISVESATGPNLELAASRSLQVAESNGGSNDQQPRLLLEHPSFVSVEELARRKGIEHIKTSMNSPVMVCSTLTRKLMSSWCS
jgi:hypothetical protein